MRRLILLIALLILLLVIHNGFSKYIPSNSLFNSTSKLELPKGEEKVKVIQEESVVVDTVKKVGPSVVTVAEELQASSQIPYNIGPFFFLPPDNGEQPQGPQNIGSGFVVSTDGLIVTNKHVVADVGAKYQVITSDDKKYDVQKIYRDPLNDVAIIKIDPSQNPLELKPVELGDSSKLEVGQFVIAIGTALGEFKNTVTTGVISGLARGIVAGGQLQSDLEQIGNVIQTDAAINPGNSGGPLLNSSGQVIGVNTAIARGGENIGFALPINVVKDSMKNFNETGQFNRPYLGISYYVVSRDQALINNIPEGAYVRAVISGSAAEKTGLRQGDIIIEIDGKRIQGKAAEISTIISKKKVGDTLSMKVWRPEGNVDDGSGKTIDLKAVLEQAPNQ
ncbi:MAG: trypsin-like peptidase domain-containing protein [Candidatus Levybacteria bacterium]|nr:trypsin-like peptidase domain-containing protein [Candidatus Levybacteria bacterium]